MVLGHAASRALRGGLSAFVCSLLWGCAAAPPSPAPAVTSAPAAESSPPPETKLKMLASGLGVVDLAAGSGPEAKAGDQLHVHYVAWLEDGTEVDSSRARGKPYTFELGAGTAIKAWDEGLVGMQAGGKRRLIVPSPLGYGAAGSPPSIPPDALLEFEVELLQIE